MSVCGDRILQSCVLNTNARACTFLKASGLSTYNYLILGGRSGGEIDCLLLVFGLPAVVRETMPQVSKRNACTRSLAPPTFFLLLLSHHHCTVGTQTSTVLYLPLYGMPVFTFIIYGKN